MRLLLPIAMILLSHTTFSRENIQIASQPSWLFETKPDLSKKVDLKKVSNGFYLELYDRQVNVNEQSVYTRYTRHIVNETGIQEASEVSVVFSPEYQALDFHFVRIIRDGKIINHLSRADIKVVQEETDVANHQYNGLKRAFIILKNTRKNDRVEVAYTLRGFNPVYNDKYTHSAYFSNDNPILNYFETIIVDARRSLHFTYFADAPAPREVQVGSNKVYHWSNPVIALWEYSSRTPSWYNPYPYVTISEYKTWKEVIDWGLFTYSNYEHQVPEKLQHRIASWKREAGTDQDEFIRKALRYVQDEIRYLGLEIGVNTHKPHSPAEVVRNGFGDCKDKALLLCAILKAQNIEAYATLVNTTLRKSLIQASPSPNSFDHVIVAIRRPDRYLFVDPTQTFQRGSISELYLPPYGYGLVVKTGETDLREIDHSFNIARVFERLKVSFNDSSTLSVNTTYRGGKADDTRSFFASTSSGDVAELYEKYYRPVFEGIQLKEEVSYEDDSIYNVIKVSENYVIPDVWSRDDSPKIVLNTYAKIIDQQLSDPAAHNAKDPLLLVFPNEIHYTLDIQMPEDWTFPNDQLHIKNESYEYNFEVENNGSLITLKYSLVTFKDHIPPSELAQYKKDYKKINETLQYELSYDPSVIGTVAPSADGVNWIVIIYLFMLAALGTGIFLYINGRTVDVPYDRNSGASIGGWMIVLGISLIAGIGVNIYNLFSGEYFSLSAYAAWQSYGTLFLLTALAELTVMTICLLASVAVFYWFIKRRDIFPWMFTAYIVTLILSQFLLITLYGNFSEFPELKNSADHGWKQIIRSMIYGAIWCTYVFRSERAKGTFLKRAQSKFF